MTIKLYDVKDWTFMLGFWKHDINKANKKQLNQLTHKDIYKLLTNGHYMDAKSGKPTKLGERLGFVKVARHENTIDDRIFRHYKKMVNGWDDNSDNVQVKFAEGVTYPAFDQIEDLKNILNTDYDGLHSKAYYHASRILALEQLAKVQLFIRKVLEATKHEIIFSHQETLELVYCIDWLLCSHASSSKTTNKELVDSLNETCSQLIKDSFGKMPLSTVFSELDDMATRADDNRPNVLNVSKLMTRGE